MAVEIAFLLGWVWGGLVFIIIKHLNRKRIVK